MVVWYVLWSGVVLASDFGMNWFFQRYFSRIIQVFNWFCFKTFLKWIRNKDIFKSNKIWKKKVLKCLVPCGLLYVHLETRMTHKSLFLIDFLSNLSEKGFVSFHENLTKDFLETCIWGGTFEGSFSFRTTIKQATMNC